MPRVRRGPKRAQKRRKILKQAKGYYGARSKAHRIAKEAVERAGAFAYRDRRQKKRQFRRPGRRGGQRRPGHGRRQTLERRKPGRQASGEARLLDPIAKPR